MTPDEYQNFVIDCIIKLRKEAMFLAPHKRDEQLAVAFDMMGELEDEGYDRYMERVVAGE